MKLKVGDYVRIKSRQEMIRDGAREIIFNANHIDLTFPSRDNEFTTDSCTFVIDMDKYCNNIYKIRSLEKPIFNGDHPIVTLEGVLTPAWTFIEPMFTPENKKKLTSCNYKFKEELL